MFFRIENDLNSVYEVYFMGSSTTIKLRKDTKKELARIGTKEETYEDIVNRLIRFYRENSEKSARVKS